jgi:DNA repair photolyase
LTYLLDDDADPPGLEPELGTLGQLIEFFGTLENRYLIVHTKTYNTEWLRDLKHNGNTIFVWSLSGSTQSRAIEPKTGTTEERIRAARIAQEAGYTVRYKFKPIIPVVGWREDAEQAVKQVFEETRPDVISLCCFMWMPVEEMKRRLPVDKLDPVFLKAAEDASDRMADTRAQPFPPEVRKQVYEHYLREIRRWNKEIPVSLSTENFSMWGELQDALGYSATSYPCGCGPMTVPGAPRLACHPFRSAVRNDRGLIPGVYG